MIKSTTLGALAVAYAIALPPAATPSAPADDERAAILALASAEKSNAVVCNHVCPVCWNGYEVVASGSSGTHQDEPYSCAPVTCPAPCQTDPGDSLATAQVSDAEIDALWQASASGDADYIRELEAKHPSKIVANVGRRAIQVLGCNDLIVAHVPLTTQVSALLSAPSLTP